MSTNIFASLENFLFTAPKVTVQPPKRRRVTASASATFTPSVAGQKRTLPSDFDAENSQHSRSLPYDSSPIVGSGPLPPPNFAGLNMMTIARQYLVDREVNVEDSEEVIRFVQVRHHSPFIILFTYSTRRRRNLFGK